MIHRLKGCCSHGAYCRARTCARWLSTTEPLPVFCSAGRFPLSSGHRCSSLQRVSGKGTFITGRPATPQTSIPVLASPATCPRSQLTPFSRRHFSNRKPSSSREKTPLLFPQPHGVTLHLPEVKHTVRENKTRVTESSPGDAGGGDGGEGVRHTMREGQPRGVGGQLHTRDGQAPSFFSKLLLAFTPVVALTKLFPSHTSAPRQTG